MQRKIKATQTCSQSRMWSNLYIYELLNKPYSANPDVWRPSNNNIAIHGTKGVQVKGIVACFDANDLTNDNLRALQKWVWWRSSDYLGTPSFMSTDVFEDIVKLLGIKEFFKNAPDRICGDEHPHVCAACNQELQSDDNNCRRAHFIIAHSKSVRALKPSAMCPYTGCNAVWSRNCNGIGAHMYAKADLCCVREWAPPKTVVQHNNPLEVASSYTLSCGANYLLTKCYGSYNLVLLDEDCVCK